MQPAAMALSQLLQKRRCAWRLPRARCQPARDPADGGSAFAAKSTVALGRNKEARSCMRWREVNEAAPLPCRAAELQTYNAMFVEGQRRLVEALPHDSVAGGGPPAV
jgi:beta-N-acetylhexosaminidase